MALKYFGVEWESTDPTGTTIEIDNADLIISGVFTNPASSSLQFDWLRPAQAYIKDNNWVESWSNGGFYIAFTFVDGVDVKSFSGKLEQEINNHTDDGSDERLVIQKFSDGYLYGTYQNGVQTTGRIENVRILTIVAFFILVIACINFMNLATARSVRRAQEIGLRKVMGARKGALVFQFLTESMVMSVASVLLSLVIVYLVLPYFNNLTGKLMFLDFSQPYMWLGTILVALTTGLLSGSYPALLLPSLKITSSLKGTLKHSKGATFFRKDSSFFNLLYPSCLSSVLLQSTIKWITLCPKIWG